MTKAVLLTSVIVMGCGDGSGSVDAKRVFPDPRTAELAEAAAKGDRARVRQLVQSGADPNARGDRGVNLLQWALLNQSGAGLEALLESGADPARPDFSGETAVHYAAKANDSSYLYILLDHGANPNTPHGVTRMTPLMSALMGDREAQFRLLLAAGAQPNQADRMGSTALHVAAKVDAYQSVLDLLKAGADPAARNQQGVTFQRYLLMTPDDVLTDNARAQRQAIALWLREHEVPVENPSAR